MGVVNPRHYPIQMTIPIEEMAESEWPQGHFNQLSQKAFGSATPGEIVKEVYELANLGMSNRLIANKYGIAQDTLVRHFYKTLAQAKADKAAVLYRIIDDRLTLTDYKATEGPDMDCVKLLLKRIDPEPKEAPDVVINQTFSDAKPSMTITDINAELLDD